MMNNQERLMELGRKMSQLLDAYSKGNLEAVEQKLTEINNNMDNILESNVSDRIFIHKEKNEELILAGFSREERYTV